MSTTDPAPEWDWYSQRDLAVGEARSSVYTFLFDGEYDEVLEELKEKERRRIKPGFHVEDSKRQVSGRRPAKAQTRTRKKSVAVRRVRRTQ